MASGGNHNHHHHGDGETSSPARANRAAHMTTSAQVHPSFAAGHQFRSVGNAQQNSTVLDPAVVNAAATIAVATAQAVHQVNNVLGAQTAAATPSIAAALGDARNPLLQRQAPMPTVAQIAAMLSNPGMQAPFNSNQASRQQFMNLGGGMQSSQAQAALPSLPSTSAVAPSATVTSTQAQNMQSWSAEQLEKHVALLHQLNRPVPQYVGLLLTEARRKQKKKHAKRIANRRSASTSRARKKKYVEEMKVTNARLKRQALILSLLPDLVVAISTDGEITFCSAQVERVLKYKADDLIGAKLSTLLVPASRDDLQTLISEMASGEEKEQSPESAQPAAVGLESKRRRIEKRESGADTDRAKVVAADRNGDGNGSGRSSENTASAALVSDQSFPLSVVEVDSKQARRPDRLNTEPTENSNENSDASTNNSNGKAQMSSLTTSTTSPTVSSGDEKVARENGSRGSNDGSAKSKRAASSDDSSSLSSDAKNMSKANENLNRNVRRHNQKMMEDRRKGPKGPKDDVTGASVTANNATARLSSLKHVPDFSKNKDDKARYESNGDQSSSDDSLLTGVEEKKKATENASDDSGYRESNDSREEMSSSGSDTSNSNGQQQKKPLSSTCRMCLIRQDLTTVWCEVTSSVRTRLNDEESFDSPSNPSKSSGEAPEKPATAAPKEDLLEVLLCLRPIRNGEKSVDESLRFVPVQQADTAMDEGDTVDRDGIIVSSSSENVKKMESSSGSGSGSGSGNDPSGKRTLPAEEENVKQRKKQKTAAKGKPSTLDTEQAVETLMFLNKSSQ
mmetsp:Transcript_45032/g.108932  ORF Transcript_45032/g.108932 Transcript_45032/m.108932 type:complete len:794 (-) Transcript_45032:147-2528(-)